MEEYQDTGCSTDSLSQWWNSNEKIRGQRLIHNWILWGKDLNSWPPNYRTLILPPIFIRFLKVSQYIHIIIGKSLGVEGGRGRTLPPSLKKFYQFTRLYGNKPQLSEMQIGESKLSTWQTGQLSSFGSRSGLFFGMG